jgi:PAS domain S-box-containing protein
VHKSDIFLSLLTEGGATGCWTYNPLTQRVWADAACRALLQCTDGSAGSLQALLAQLPLQQQAGLQAEILRASTQHGSFVQTVCLQDKPAPVWLNLRGRWSPLPDAASGGELVCVVERALQGPGTPAQDHRLTHELSAMLAGSPVTLFQQDADLRYLWVFAPRMGLQVSAMLGRTASDFLEPESAKTLDDAKRAVMESDRPLRQQILIQPKTNAGSKFDLYIAPTHGPDGQVTGVISVSIDMAAASEREQRLLAIFEGAPVAIALARASDGVYIKANPPFLEMFGYSKSEVIGATSASLNLWHPPESRDQMRDALRSTGHVRNLVNSFRHKSGHIYKALVSIELLELGGEMLMLGIMTDITDLDNARQSLALSEARYKLLSEASFEGVSLSRDGVVVEANDQVARLLGVTREDLIGRPVTQHMLPSDASRAESRRRSDSVAPAEYNYLRPDGRAVVLEVNSKNMLHNGDLLRISAVRDITEKKQKEQALRYLQARFSHMVDSNMVGVYVAQSSGQILEANDYFLNLLGRQRLELEQGLLHVPDITAPGDLGLSFRMRDEVLRTGACKPYEKSYLNVQGQPVDVLVAVSLLPETSSRILAIVVDISELKAAQSKLLELNEQLVERTQRAEHAEAAKTSFLSSVSHELRTPLHTVLGYVRLLRKKASGDDLQQLSVVEHSSNQLLRLIDDLLEFNQSAKAPQRLLPELVVLDGFLSNLKSIGAAAAAASGNEFVTELRGFLPTAIMVDEMRLVQVLRILIDNACKYTQSGVVVFSLSPEQPDCLPDPARPLCLHFSVEDTGRGIDARDLEHIFEPLCRGSNTADRPGLGLGLAIAEQWITRMHSRIAVQSLKGIGSKFSFALELEAVFEAPSTQHAAHHSTDFSALQAHTDVHLQALPARELETLGELIHMGRLGRLLDWTQAVADRYPEHRAGAQEVAELANHAKLDALLRLYRRWAALAVTKRSNREKVEDGMSASDCPSIAVVEDDLPTLQLICGMLQTMGYNAQPFESANSMSIARRSQQFHAMVLDLSMPDLDGFELLYQLTDQTPLVPLIIVSSQPPAIIQAASAICTGLGLTVLGVLSKPFASDELALLLKPYTRGAGGAPGTRGT